MFQTKVQDKSPKKDLNEIEISHVLDKEIKAMVIKMLTNLRRRMDDHRDQAPPRGARAQAVASAARAQAVASPAWMGSLRFSSVSCSRGFVDRAPWGW